MTEADIRRIAIRTIMQTNLLTLAARIQEEKAAIALYGAEVVQSFDAAYPHILMHALWETQVFNLCA